MEFKFYLATLEIAKKKEKKAIEKVNKFQDSTTDVENEKQTRRERKLIVKDDENSKSKTAVPPPLPRSLAEKGDFEQFI